MTEQENKLLTQVSPGTPCGELMRRYWIPAALSEELPQGGAPLPVRLLGEDLVLFRDDQGKPGLLGIHCSHRGADLSYGRVEDGGLRCIYHGWLYDIHGRCLDQPGEPDGGEHRDSIRHPAYPCEERAGVVFTYMGPGNPALFPNYEFLVAPDDRVFAIKLFSECNYWQGNEGNIDLTHLSFMHYNSSRPEPGDRADGILNSRGAAPGMEFYDTELTAYGVRSYKIRRLNKSDKYHLFMTEFVLPSFTTFFGGQYPVEGAYAVNWHVPIDDKHHWKYTFIFSRKRALNKEAMRKERAEMTRDYKPIRHKGNRYLQDKESMKDQSYSGMGVNFQVQDLCVTEGMGYVQDRTNEHLTSQDIALVAARKILFKAIKELQGGREPANVVRDPKANYFLIDACSDLVSQSHPWKEYVKGLESRIQVKRER